MHLEMGRPICVAGKTVGNYLEAGWGRVGCGGESLKGAVCVFLVPHPVPSRICPKAGTEERGGIGVRGGANAAGIQGTLRS